MRPLLACIGLLIAGLIGFGCSDSPATEDDPYDLLFEAVADPTPDSLDGIYVIVNVTDEGQLYVYSIDEQSRLRVAIDATSFHLAASCLDGVIIGATVDADHQPGSPDHLQFAGEDATSRQDGSGQPCRLSLGEGLWGGRPRIDLDGLTLVIESADDPTSNITLRKISDWPESA